MKSKTDTLRDRSPKRQISDPPVGPGTHAAAAERPRRRSGLSLGAIGKGEHSESARKFLQSLHDRGESQKSIADAAGIARSTATGIIHHRRKKPETLVQFLFHCTDEERKILGYAEYWATFTKGKSVP